MYYTVDNALDKSWSHWTGHVTPEMVKETMPAPNEPDSIVMLCGPDHLLNHVAGNNMDLLDSMSGGKKIQPMATEISNMGVLGGILGDLNYGFEQVYRF